MIQLKLSNGLTKKFEINVEQLHQLRHGTAKLLKEMAQLNRHPISRILKDIENKRMIKNENQKVIK